MRNLYFIDISPLEFVVLTSCEALSCPLFHLNLNFTAISEAGKGGVIPITQMRKLRVRHER